MRIRLFHCRKRRRLEDEGRRRGRGRVQSSAFGIKGYGAKSTKGSLQTCNAGRAGARPYHATRARTRHLHAALAGPPIRRQADTSPLDGGDRRRMVGKRRKVRHYKGRLWVGEKISKI